MSTLIASLGAHCPWCGARTVIVQENEQKAVTSHEEPWCDRYREWAAERPELVVVPPAKGAS
jgi:hypothetical protein